jgi:cellulose synthase operon protein C
VRITKRRHRPSLLGSCFLAFTLLLASQSAVAARSPSLSTDFYEDALERFQVGDSKAAIIQLKNALQEDSSNLPARILLGMSYLREGAIEFAEKELRQARALGVDVNLIAEPLATAYLLQRKYDEVFSDIDERRLNTKSLGTLRTIQGKAYIQNNALREAAFAFREAKALLPDSPEPDLGLAVVALQEGNSESARAFALAASRIGPDSPQTWYVFGEIERDGGDSDAALEHYSKALELQPEHVLALSARASTLVSLDRGEQATADLDRLDELSPNDPQVTYLRALMLAQTGDITQARAVLQSATQYLLGMDQEWIQSNGPSLLLMGFIAHGEGNFDIAHGHLNRYVKFFPRNVGARKLLADIYLRRNQPLSAIETLQPAVALAPKDSAILLMMGTAYAQRGRPEDAVRMLEKAVALAPDAMTMRTQLALNRIAIGDNEGALSDLLAATEADPDSSRPSVLLTMLSLKSSDFASAAKYASSLISQFPEDPVGYNLLGAARLGLERIDGARASFKRALSIAPGFHSANLNLAKLEMDHGAVTQARKIFVDVLEQSPKEIRAMLGLSKLDEKIGDRDGAIEWLEKVRAIVPKQVPHQLKLVDLYLAENNLAKAQAITTDLEAKYPDQLPVLIAVGRVQMARGTPGEAVKTFVRMSKLAGYSADQLHALSHYQIKVGDLDGAKWSLQKAVKATPEHLGARSTLVRLIARQGYLDEALAEVEKLREEFPDESNVDALLGDVLVAANRFDAGADAYHQAHESSPSSTLAIRRYQARARSGDSPIALQRLSAWLESHPNDLAARRVLALGFLRNGDYAASTTHHEWLVGELPNEPAVLNNLAWLYFQASDVRALTIAERAHALAPTEASVLDTLGWILVGEGQPRVALQYLRDALSRASENSGFRYHLAVALNAMGRNTEATKELKTALAGRQPFSERTDAQELLRKLETP